MPAVLVESEKQIMQAAEGVRKRAQKCCAARVQAADFALHFQGMEEEA